MTERRSSLDLDAAMAALEGRASTASMAADGEAVAQAARLPRRAPRQAVRGNSAGTGSVARIRSLRTDRIHMFSTRASAATLNALYSLVREERRTVTELFEEAVELLVHSRGKGAVRSRSKTDW